MNIIEGTLDATSLKFGIVVSRFNQLITQQLLIGAIDCLTRHGADANNITVVWVPGAFEIPLAIQALAEQKTQDALLALGAVIRGETPHFDYVASESASGVSKVALQFRIPICNGILTTNTLEQALDRAGSKAGNKGSDAALSAIEMIRVLRKIG